MKTLSKKKSKITTVVYSRLKNLGDFENERLEVSIEVGEGEAPEAAVIRAKIFVLQQLKIAPDTDLTFEQYWSRFPKLTWAEASKRFDRDRS